jgi:fibronectin-binding autotransporter adhesin
VLILSVDSFWFDLFPKLRRRAFGALATTSLVALGSLALPSAGFADELTWDAGGGNVNWNTTDTFWDPGPGPNIAFSNGDDAVFDGAAELAVIIPTAVQPGSIRFGADGYSISGGTISDATTTPVLITVTNIGDTAVINSALDGAFSFSGNGTLNLGGNSPSLSALAVSSGTVENLAAGIIGGTVTNTGTFTNSGTVFGVVNNSGGIFSSTLTVGNGGVVDTDGAVTLSGTVGTAGVSTDGGDITVAAAGLTTTGALGVVGSVANGAATATLTGDLGATAINASGVFGGNLGTVTINSTATVTDTTITSGGVVTVGGTLTSTNAVSVQDEGVLNVTGAGAVTNAIDITAGGEANLANSVGGDITNTSGTVNVTAALTAGGDLITNGAAGGPAVTNIGANLGLTGDLNLNGLDVVNTSTVNITAGTTTVNAVGLAGFSTLEVDGTLNSTNAITVVNNSTVTVNGGGALGADFTVNTGGTLSAIGLGAINGNVTVAGGALSSTGSISGSVTDTNGTTALTGTVGTGVSTLGGAITVGAMGLTVTTGDFTVTGDGGNGAGLATIDGNLGITTGDLIVGGVAGNTGTAIINAGNTVTATDVVMNANGTIVVAGTLNSGSDINIQSDAILQVNSGGIVGGNVTENAGGFFSMSAGEVSGDLTLDSANGGTVMGTVGGNLVANGGIRNVTGGDLTVTGNITNATTMVVFSGTSGDNNIISGANFTNNGTLNVQVDAAVTSTAALENNSGATLTNAGTINNVNNNLGAILTSTGAISGTLTNAGTASFSGATASVGTLANSGTVNVAALSNLTVTNPLTNTSTISNLGTITGDIANNAGGTVGSSGTITGTLTNAATSVGANLGGNVGAIVNDGTVTLTDDLTVTGAFDNNATFTMGANDLSVGSMTNNQAFTVTSGQTLTTTAALVNEAGGTITVDGIIDGPLTNSTLTSAVNLTGAGSSVTGAVDNTGTIGLAGGTLGGLPGGTVQNNATGILNASGGNFGGDVTNDGTVNLSANTNALGDFTNNLALNSSAPVTLDVTGTFTNNGTITSNSGQLTISANLISLTATSVVGGAGTVNLVGDILNLGTVTYNAAETLTGNYTNGSTAIAVPVLGLTDVNAAVDADGNDITNNRDFNVNAGGSLVNVGTLTNATAGITNATFDIAGGASVGTQTVVNTGALSTMTVVGGLTAATTLTNTLGATLDNSGTVAAAITNSVGGVITNSGTITGAVTSTGTGGAPSSLTNTGTITGNVSTDQFTTLASSNLITGDLAAGGTTTISGNVTGNVTNTATNALGSFTLTNDLTVGGNFDNSGEVIANAGSLTAATLTNNGAGVIGIGAGESLTLTGATTFNSAGTITNAGTINTSVVNQVGGSLTSTNAITGSVTNNNAFIAQGTVGGDVINTAGTTTVSGNLAVTGDVSNAGIVNVSGGNLTAVNLNNTAGGAQATVSAARVVTLSGGISNDGTYTNNGTTNATAAIANTGLITNTGTMTAASVTTSGTLNTSNSLTVTGVVANTGTLSNTGTLAATTVTSTNSLSSTNTLNANVQSSGAMTLAGTMTGNLETTAGSVNAQGTLTGALTSTGGTITTDGNLAVSGALSSTADVTVTAGNLSALTFDASGVTQVGAGRSLTAGTINNNAGGTLTANGALVGNVNNASGATLTSNLSSSGALGNAGTANVGGTVGAAVSSTAGTFSLAGNLSVAGAFANGGTLEIGAGETLTTTNLLNTGTTNNAGDLTGSLNNSGTYNATSLAASTFAAGEAVTNSGTIHSRETITFGGGLNSVAGQTSIVSVASEAGFPDSIPLTENINITGALTGNHRFILDLDLTDDGFPLNGAQHADTVFVTGGPVTGNVILQFNLITNGFGPQDQDIPVFVVDAGQANAFTFSSAGLPQVSETVIYTLSQPVANGDIFVVDQVNPAIGGLAGNVILTQSLIGAVINRPSSPFVAGLAYEDVDPCGPGAWARVLGGGADVKGSTSNGVSNVASELSSNFYGVQVGGDFACFRGLTGGWDFSAGAILGINKGSSYQPVRAIDPNNATVLSPLITSDTRGSFNQAYGGIYGTAAKGPFAFDLQYRYEKTNFEINNEPRVGWVGLGLDNEKYTSTASTISGAVSYARAIGETGITVVPTAGFAYSQIKTDRINFTGIDADPDVDATLDIADTYSAFGFIGASLSKTSYGDDGTTALNRFVTATLYNDFAPATESTFTDPGGTPETLRSENLGAYGEISAGVNFVKILDPGQVGASKQFNASIRGDVRLSPTVKSWGITAQLRLQF